MPEERVNRSPAIVAVLLVAIVAAVVLSLWGFAETRPDPSTLRTTPPCGPVEHSNLGDCPQTPAPSTTRGVRDTTTGTVTGATTTTH